MNIEKTLADELRAVGAAVRPPAPPEVTALVRAAEQDRLRTRLRAGAGVVLAAAVVLGAILLGNQLGKPESAPNPEPLPTSTPTPTTSPDAFAVGAPPRTYVDDDGVLHLDGVAVAGGSWVSARTRGDLTIALHSGAETGSGDVSVFIGSTPVGSIGTVMSWEQVVVSPDRRTIAWTKVEDGGRAGGLVVAEVGADGVRELGQVTVRSLTLSIDDEGRERLLAVGDDGTATYGGVAGGHSWKPGGRPRVADVSSYQLVQGFPDDAEDVHLNPTGTWGAWLTDAGPTIRPGEAIWWTSVTFQQPDRVDTRATLPMPVGDRELILVDWEDDTHLMLTVLDEGSATHLVRCDVETHACERAPTPTGS